VTGLGCAEDEGRGTAGRRPPDGRPWRERAGTPTTRSGAGVARGSGRGGCRDHRRYGWASGCRGRAS